MHIEAPFGIEEELSWFYVEVGNLQAVEPNPPDQAKLCFKSGRLKLHICLTENPQIEPIACRVTLLVPSLPGTEELLDEHGLAYERLSGMMWTDLRVLVNDPAGNCVELKQEWPYAPL